jgi:hypothetical protein
MLRPKKRPTAALCICARLCAGITAAADGASLLLCGKVRSSITRQPACWMPLY